MTEFDAAIEELCQLLVAESNLRPRVSVQAVSRRSLVRLASQGVHQRKAKPVTAYF